MESTQEIVDYLNKDGNHWVPCGRYGRNTFECAPVAAELAEYIADATGEELSVELVEYAMSLVVNSHDDVAELLGLGENDDI